MPEFGCPNNFFEILIVCIKRHTLFQVHYPKLAESKVIISAKESASNPITVFLSELNFLNSYWILNNVNLEMINCHASSLVLELKDLTNVTIQNCTLGNWTFRKVQNIFIKNVTNTFNEGIPTSLKFYNSSPLIKNIIIEHENLTGPLEGISVQDFSILHIDQSYFVNNTVKHGLIKAVNLSKLIMSNCNMLGNYAEENAAVIYANESFVNLTNTYLENNKANRVGGTIVAERLSRLQIGNCTFINNEANHTGGAIYLTAFSEAHLFNVYFAKNGAKIGGAIHIVDNSTLNANYLYASQNRALTGSVTSAIGSCNISCENCFLSENIVQHKYGAAFQIFYNSIIFVSHLRCLRQMGNRYGCICATFHCILCVNNSTFAMNRGSVIQLSTNSNLTIIDSKFVNNTVPGDGGAILSLNNSLIDVSYSLFDGNKADHGGAIYQNSGEMKLNQCLFLRNSESALMGVASETCIENSHFEDNVGQHHGGALNMEKSILNVSNTTFKNNKNKNNANHDLNGGAAILLYQSVGNISKSGFYNNYASRIGGSMCLFDSSLSVIGVTFQNNVAGILGGAIYSNDNVLDVEYSNFVNNSVLNKVQGMGGCLYLVGNSMTKISEVLFSECHARYGGAIEANLTKFIMANSYLTGNTGSAIYLVGIYVDINNCTFFNNSAPEYGGAIVCAIYSDVKVVNSNFSKNKAVLGGGAVYAERTSSFKMFVHNCSFTYNTASSGGAMFVMDSNVSISHSNYSNNIATDGGVAQLNSGNIVMANCRIIMRSLHLSLSHTQPQPVEPQPNVFIVFIS